MFRLRRRALRQARARLREFSRPVERSETRHLRAVRTSDKVTINVRSSNVDAIEIDTPLLQNIRPVRIGEPGFDQRISPIAQRAPERVVEALSVAFGQPDDGDMNARRRGTRIPRQLLLGQT